MIERFGRVVTLLILIPALSLALPAAAGETEERIEKLEQEVQALREALEEARKAGTAEDRIAEIER
jgi:hypothetical protein